MNTPANAVVVAIGADGHEAALAFAVAEARRTLRPLHLVHVLETPGAYSYVGVSEGMLELARTTLDEALAKAEALAGGDVAVTAELVDHGWIVDDLVRHTDGASLLVLQHRAHGRAKRVFSTSTAEGIVSRAHVPVISVPEGWTADRRTSGVVTAGVQDAIEASALLRAGFDEADARHAELVVLHVWWLSSGYDVAVVDDAMRDEYSSQFRQELEPLLEPLRQEFPDVEAKILVRHAPRVEAVLDAAELSDLLVLGRRHHLLPLGSHLGSVARAAIEHSTCPVLVTPEPAAPAAGPQYSDLLASIGHHETTS